MTVSLLYSFADLVIPVLQAGTYTNYGKTPKFFLLEKKNQHARSKNPVWVENRGVEDYEQAWDGSLISYTLVGLIGLKQHDNTNKQKLKADIYNIISANFTADIMSGNDTPVMLNHEQADFFIKILKC